MIINNRLTITMDCWSNYKDARTLFFESLRNNWKDLPYPIVVACDSSLEDENIPGKVIKCDNSLTDSKRHLCAINDAETEYVLLIVEDGLITNKIDNNRIESILNYMDANHINFCKMVPIPNKKGRKIQGLSHAKFINKRQAYGINYLCGIYRKSYLKQLLDSKCKDSWEIEAKLLNDACKMEKGYYNDKMVVTDNPLHIIFCIEQGKWSYWAASFIKKHGYAVNSNRERWSFFHDLLARIKHAASSSVPIRMRRNIKKLLTKVGFHFTVKD